MASDFSETSTFYDILSISRDATETEIKAAYQRKIKLFHPDHNLGNEKESSDAFNKIVEAYKTLSNPKTRMLYDRSITLTLKPHLNPDLSKFLRTDTPPSSLPKIHKVEISDGIFTNLFQGMKLPHSPLENVSMKKISKTNDNLKGQLQDFIDKYIQTDKSQVSAGMMHDMSVCRKNSPLGLNASTFNQLNFNTRVVNNTVTNNYNGVDVSKFLDSAGVVRTSSNNNNSPSSSSHCNNININSNNVNSSNIGTTSSHSVMSDRFNPLTSPPHPHHHQTTLHSSNMNHNSQILHCDNNNDRATNNNNNNNNQRINSNNNSGSNINIGNNSVGCEDDILKDEEEEPSSLQTTINVSFEESVHGCKKHILFFRDVVCHSCNQSALPSTHCNRCNGSGNVKTEATLLVEIPPGVPNGWKKVYKGEGDVTRAGKGDLTIYFHVESHQLFYRVRNDVVCELPISFSKATLGTTLHIPTIYSPVPIEIPAGTEHGTNIVLKNLGFSSVDDPSVKGDMIVNISIIVPKVLTAPQRDLLSKLDSLFDHN